MFDHANELEIEAALRDGLRRAPAPAPSAEFDARVLAALAKPTPWWQSLLTMMRPACMGAGLSLVLMLALVSYVAGTPAGGHPSAARAQSAGAIADDTLDSPNLSAASLTRLTAVRPPVAPEPAPPAARPAVRHPGSSRLPETRLSPVA